MYKLIGMLSSLEIAEMCARSGANCGSLFLDLRFRELVKTLLADHPAHLDGKLSHLSVPLSNWVLIAKSPIPAAASLAYFMHNFSETTKMVYQGEADDGQLIPYTYLCTR